MWLCLGAAESRTQESGSCHPKHVRWGSNEMGFLAIQIFGLGGLLGAPPGGPSGALLWGDRKQEDSRECSGVQLTWSEIHRALFGRDSLGVQPGPPPELWAPSIVTPHFRRLLGSPTGWLQAHPLAMLGCPHHSHSLAGT